MDIIIRDASDRVQNRISVVNSSLNLADMLMPLLGGGLLFKVVDGQIMVSGYARRSIFLFMYIKGCRTQCCVASAV